MRVLFHLPAHSLFRDLWLFLAAALSDRSMTGSGGGGMEFPFRSAPVDEHQRCKEVLSRVNSVAIAILDFLDGIIWVHSYLIRQFSRAKCYTVTRVFCSYSERRGLFQSFAIR